MSKRRYVSTSFWDDGYIVEADPIEKLLFLYFLTNTLSNIAGIYEIAIKRIAYDTGIDKEMVLKIIERFTKAGKIYYIDGWIYIKNFEKHQNTDNSKIKEGINRIKQDIPSSILEKIGAIDESYIGHIGVSNNFDFDLDSDLDLDGKSVMNENPIIEEKKNIFKLFKNKSYLTIEEVDRLKSEYPNKIIDDYIEDVENYIVNNPKGKSVKDVNLTIRNRLRKNGVKKRETTITKAVETDDFFTSLQKEIGV